jgi:mevalonate pyrophosphate decarboxylase
MPPASRRFTFTFDSGSNVHVFSLADALALFTHTGASNLTIVGVSGNATRADLMGHVVASFEDPSSGSV